MTGRQLVRQHLLDRIVRLRRLRRIESGLRNAGSGCRLHAQLGRTQTIMFGVSRVSSS
jgi:hypothetical protein